MRTANPAYAAARTAFTMLNGLYRQRLNVDEMPDHLRRDLGLTYGRSRYDATFADGDGRSRSLDHLTLTRFAA
jgi:hypothetical protein